MYINLSEEGGHKVANVPTGVDQDAILDHMGSDFRCQNEVMTTKKCVFFHCKTNDSVVFA